MAKKGFQEYYPEDLSWCYGCGWKNEHGHHIKSYWDGEESVCYFEPQPYHTAVPGIVYGGLIASLIDCHSTGTAAAAVHREEGREMGTEPPVRFVTASLHVDYLQPTPMGIILEIRGQVKEINGKKVVIESTVLGNNEVCARGEVVAIRIPKALVPRGTTAA